MGTTSSRLFESLGDDELREVIDYLDGGDLGCLQESGVVGEPANSLLRRWFRRWRRNRALSAAFAFLDLGDLGLAVSAWFSDDPGLAHSAHEVSLDKLKRGPVRRRDVASTLERVSIALDTSLVF